MAFVTYRGLRPHPFRQIRGLSHRHFEESQHSQLYSVFRPKPPHSLIEKILSELPSQNRNLALDVGCGSGQSSFGFQPYFKQTVGIDVSETQIKEALKLISPGSNTTFKVGTADPLDFPDSSVDLLTCCQTIHWLDIEKFYHESDRVLKPGGLLAIIGYHFTAVSPTVPQSQDIERLKQELYETTQPYWDSKRCLVDDGYSSIPQIPYKDSLRDDSHYTEVKGSLEDFIGYVSTWSGYREYRKVHGDGLLQDFRDQCSDLLNSKGQTPNEHEPLALRTNYFLLLGRKAD